MDKPLLMLDVDGVISLLGFAQSRARAARFVLVDGIRHYPSASSGNHVGPVGSAGTADGSQT